MDERLLYAPCGYLSIDNEHKILTANDTFLGYVGYDLQALRGCRLESVLTRTSRVFYSIYFSPLIKLNSRVEEMYLSLLTLSGSEFPVLLTANRRERDGVVVNDCIVMPMRRRAEYERQLTEAEHAVSRALAEMKRMEGQLQEKQKKLAELESELEQKERQLRASEQAAASSESPGAHEE